MPKRLNYSLRLHIDMRTFNPYFRNPRSKREPISANHKVGFYNTELQCKCIRGSCNNERSNECTHDPSIVFDLLKPISKELVPTSLITAMFEQLDYKHNNCVSGNL